MSQRQQTRETLQQLHLQARQALSATGSEQALEIIDERFEAILSALDSGQEYTYLAQDAVSNLITMHPNLTHLVPRELLWQLGGSCLHILSDEEIDQFSQQSELH
jgi:hypothetical protein